MIKNGSEIIHKSEICAIVITYNAKKFIAKTIYYLLKNIDNIVVVDNNSTDGTIEVIKNMQSPNVHLILNKKNYGIAKALNQGVEYASKRGFEWVLTMDQDSIISENMINEMNKVYSSLTCFERRQVACLAPRIIYNDENDKRQTSNNSYREKDVVITSGNLVKISAINLVGGYEESLFIDSVDFDFCLKLKKQKLKILVCNNAVMNHSLGETFIKKIFGVSFLVHTHSQIRKYYIARNHVYIIKKYLLSDFSFCFKKNFFFLIFVFQNVIIEDNRVSNIKVIFKGLLDGIKGKYGEKSIDIA
ncbi:glycosyltransferase [Pseudoclostridium thermosuccinogenes]|jgi:rhamnosyltransferase|uniref:glycosyltransferase n=1 Tax=Clostridium thermosuccinogenes TaxID=84032 RepID=UPI002FD9F716